MPHRLVISLLIFLTLSISPLVAGTFLDQAQESDLDLTKLSALASQLQSSRDPDRAFALGIIYHNQATLGKYDVLDESLNLLNTTWKTTKNPLALAYYGSAVTLLAAKANKKGDVPTAVMKSQEGVRLLDQAVQTAPDRLDVRVLRINNSFGLSEGSPFKRYDVIAADLGVIKQHLSECDDTIKAFFYLATARLQLHDKKVSDGMKSLEQAIRTAPKSGYAVQAKKLLSELED